MHDVSQQSGILASFCICSRNPAAVAVVVGRRRHRSASSHEQANKALRRTPGARHRAFEWVSPPAAGATGKCVLFVARSAETHTQRICCAAQTAAAAKSAVRSAGKRAQVGLAAFCCLAASLTTRTHCAAPNRSRQRAKARKGGGSQQEAGPVTDTGWLGGCCWCCCCWCCCWCFAQSRGQR